VNIPIIITSQSTNQIQPCEIQQNINCSVLTLPDAPPPVFSSLFMSGWKGLGLQALGPDIEGCMHQQSSWNSLCSHNFSCHWHCMVLHALFQTTCHRMIGKVAM